ncbi:protein-L-isoaspartate(D-aspartate) O-methyltransferase [Microbacterium sp. STN6]|uniref:protein-L-isoaspartate(D-aspartate) O-methyltransferase n=1 Tax=Microbacterium sp. STN6 TaxID=2995588 RepID=UPI00226098D1|nr:protein-L-isoaspartate(D-aspartate) O-methyltransferase [Microbacterium sp. STN6]MCX7521147.1 protein-L-isoaspartate(D-aspartate) O-methyltransferase [Microbacterium sp. STN6]
MEKEVRRRLDMVEQQLVSRGITDARVLDAMRTVPRHEFVPARLAAEAYSDHPLPIDNGQTISQPYIVALMLEAARLDENAVLLDIGTGSGYAAAVASLLTRRVVSIERHAGLAESARRRLTALGYDNVEVIAGDGLAGWPDAAPYDAIVAAAAGPRVPDAWRDQLAVGGRIVMPLGAPRLGQRLVVCTRAADGTLEQSSLGGVAFVPLIGDGAWAEHNDEGGTDPAP